MEEERRTVVGCATLLAVGFILRALHVAWKFDVDWEPDGYQHVLYARSVFAAPPESLWLGIKVWAKPLYTFVVATYDALLPARIARIPAVQVLNACCWLASMGVVVAIVRERSRHRATLLVTCACGAFAYVFFRDSVTANTEPMGALVMALALRSWQRRRPLRALLLFGLLPLVRMDAALIGAVFWVDAARAAGGVRAGWRTVVATLCFVTPVALWNLAGFLHTGSGLYVLTHGYSSRRGTFGFGRPLHYASELLRFDPVLFVLGCLGAVRVAIDRRGRDGLIVMATIGTALHFVLLSAMWVLGIASAGLLRYFVFAYPAYLVIAAHGVDRAFDGLTRVAPRTIPAVVGVICVMALAQLHWLVRSPQMHHGLMTSVAVNPLRALPSMPAVRAARMIYTDRPEVLYYLHRTLVSADVGELDRVRDPTAEGVFVFIKGWSEFYSKVGYNEFRGLALLDRLALPDGRKAYLFRR